MSECRVPPLREGPIDPLWVCGYCEMIGEGDEARAHGLAHGHTIACLTLRESDAIRDIWAEQRARRVGAFLSYARFLKGGKPS